MEIINISPRGYCYGVVDAMVIARNASLDTSLPRPIYILGMIVHNEHITKAFEEVGIQTLDGTDRLSILEKVDSGTVIFTAHGVSPKVKEEAERKGLMVIDATCPDVMITHELIKEKVHQGFHILYIGKKNHPEPEGAVGVAPESVHLIESLAEAKEINLSQTEKLFITNQTTMSQWDVAAIASVLAARFPQAELHKDICKATQIRQEAVASQAIGCDLTLVVGDPRSNNSNRLAQVAIQQAGVPAQRISDVSEIKADWLKGVKKIAVTAGASTPTAIVREVLAFLEKFDEHQPDTWQEVSKVDAAAILPRARAKDISQQRERRLAELRREKS